jgi:hypothetical protein
MTRVGSQRHEKKAVNSVTDIVGYGICWTASNNFEGLVAILVQSNPEILSGPVLYRVFHDLWTLLQWVIS